MDEAAVAVGSLFHERYRVVRPIKTGGMGSVYEVLDLRTQSPRALKLMLSATLDNADQRARFEQEAQLTGAIDSEHIVRISDAGVDAGRPFLVMELLRGEELQTIVDKKRVLSADEALLYLTQVARALEKTHARNIIHRDLKPENLFVSQRDDGSACIKILDFGVAKIAAASQAKKTRALGTPLFMAPEQIMGSGNIQPSADLYALGHVAYAILAGEPYWTEESAAHETIVPLLKNVIAGAQEPPTARAVRRGKVLLPAAFDPWFARATALQPDQRFRSAPEQIEALRAILLSAPASTAETSQQRAATRREPTAAVAMNPASNAAGRSQQVAPQPQAPAQIGIAPNAASVDVSRFQIAPSAPSSGDAPSGGNAPSPAMHSMGAAANPPAIAHGGPFGPVPARPQAAAQTAAQAGATMESALAPKKRSMLVPALVAGGGLAAVGGIVVAIVVAKSGSTGAPRDHASASAQRSSAPIATASTNASVTKPTPSLQPVTTIAPPLTAPPTALSNPDLYCPGICEFWDPPDPTKLSLQDVLDRTIAAAHKVNASAALVQLVGQANVVDGKIDLDLGPTSGIFKLSDGGSLSVQCAQHARPDKSTLAPRLTAILSKVNIPLPPANHHPCSMEAAWDAAVIAGLPPTPGALFSYQGGSKQLYQFTIGTQSVLIDAMTCSPPK